MLLQTLKRCRVYSSLVGLAPYHLEGTGLLFTLAAERRHFKMTAEGSDNLSHTAREQSGLVEDVPAHGRGVGTR